MKIKICGLFRNEDIGFANEAMPDYIGFVFAQSRRQVTAEKAAELKSQLNKNIQIAGVFVNNDIDFIANLVHNNIIDVIQLHGSEDENYLRCLRERVKNTTVIKAFTVTDSRDISEAEKFPSDFMLLDNGKGGTGKAFSWKLLKGNMPGRTFLAGGINMDNIAEAVSLSPYCIDVSSGAETNGVKDKEKMIKLVRYVRSFAPDINPQKG